MRSSQPFLLSFPLSKRLYDESTWILISAQYPMSKPFRTHRERGGSGVDGALAGISLSITAGTSQDISHEVGGESWAAISGFESVLLVAPR